MFKIITFLAILGLSLAAPDMGVRIVNGTNATEGEFRFAVSLRNNLRHVCGATIINRKYILTAAHCVCNNSVPLNASLYSIQYGSVRISATNDRSVPVSRIVCHKFNSTTLVNDVAVLELSRDIPNDGTWAAASLATRFNTSIEGRGVVIGWGRLWANGPSPGILQKLNVDIYNDTICGARFDIREHICFGAALGGACHGDSGTSLLTLDYQQIGVSSFITNTCGTANMRTPNVYAKVDHFLPWIQQQSRI